MTSLLRLNSKTSGEDADANAALRASFRNDRKAKKQRVSDAVDIGLGRGIELSGMTEEDAKLAAIAINRRKQRRDGSDHAHKSEKNAFQSKRSENIFAAQKKSHASKTERKKSSSKCNGRLEKKEKDTTMSDKPRLRRKIELKSSTSNHLLAQSPTKQTENTSKQPLLASGMNALSGLIDHYGSDSD